MPVVQRQLGRAVYKPSLRLIHFSRNSVLFLRIASNSRNCERRIKHQDHSRGCREGSRWKPYSAIVKEIVLRTVAYLRSIAKMPSEYTAWVCSRGGGTFLWKGLGNHRKIGIKHLRNPASFPVVLCEIECDVTCHACWENLRSFPSLLRSLGLQELAWGWGWPRSRLALIWAWLNLIARI